MVGLAPDARALAGINVVSGYTGGVSFRLSANSFRGAAGTHNTVAIMGVSHTPAAEGGCKPLGVSVTPCTPCDDVLIPTTPASLEPAPSTPSPLWESPHTPKLVGGTIPLPDPSCPLTDATDRPSFACRAANTIPSNKLRGDLATNVPMAPNSPVPSNNREPGSGAAPLAVKMSTPASGAPPQSWYQPPPRFVSTSPMAPVSFQFQESQVISSAMSTTKYVCPAVTRVPGAATVVSPQQVPKVGLGGASMNPDKFTPGTPPSRSRHL